MTQKVRSTYRSNRRRTWVAVSALAAIVALAVAAMPANANGGAASGLGVNPVLADLGGQANDCVAVESTAGAAGEVRTTNPTDGQVLTIPTSIGGGKILLSLYTSNGVQYLDFKPAPGATGFYVVKDVIVKGGQKSVHYDYEASIPGSVTSDTRLHAPPKGNSYFQISHVTFCVSDGASVVTQLACDGDATDSNGRYTVQLGSGEEGNCTKSGETAFIFESYLRTDGSTAYKLVPYSPPASGSGKILLVEELTGSFTPSSTDTSPQVNLIYDDFVGAGNREMPYCDYDPRVGDTGLVLEANTYGSVDAHANAVLPDGTPAHTSCLLQGTQSVNKLAGTPTVSFTFWVFSSVDGFRFNG